jgi:thiol-disulfide isomerase/thioredoxin
MKRKLSSVILTPLFFLAIVLFCNKTFSQTLPDFKVKLTDGSTFSSSALLHKKPLLVIYFAPDCEHCRALMEQLLPQMNAFKNVQILMVTFESLDDIAWFENHYQTKKYSNMKVGMEVPVFFLKNYYHLEHTPFTALFNKNGKLMVSYKEYTPVSDLIKWVKVVEKG